MNLPIVRIFLYGLFIGAFAPTSGRAQTIDFVREIQPIFREHCFECHAGTVEEGALNLGVKSNVLRRGEHASVITAGKSDESLLIRLVAGKEAERVMPPVGRKQLTQAQVALLKAWVDQGAVWPDDTDVLNPKWDRGQQHWAFQRLRAVAVPAKVKNDDWSKTPIDLFVRHAQTEAGIRPADIASARTLVRRLYYDLIGLPPTLEQTDRFVTAYSIDPEKGVESLVNELLASPRYGERWGRHWLDVARYADSDGQEADQDRPHAYTYRDFVIQALNDDMPYDQFVRWQIAGDEYEPNNDSAIAATGFLTAGPAFKLPETFLESERLMNRYNELDDVVSTVGAGLLGLTVACARCHDHKYDAFSAEEYYQLLSVFHSGDRVTEELPSGKKAFFFRDFDNQRRTTWLFRRSDFYDREIEVEIGFPRILSNGLDANLYWQRAKEAYAVMGPSKSTLQRRAFADWLTDTEQGGGVLLARVMVNRVWHHHFGRGLVSTASDFGVQGEAPSNPELLEYLTAEFVANGWRVKELHRMILQSSVWQQASVPDACDPRGNELDPTNSLSWKRNPQRLEAEALRDTILALSETLNLEAGGKGFKPYIAPEANQARNIKGEGYPKNAKDDASTRRRSVYMFHKRLIPYPMFQAFDRPDLMVSCARRQNTTVAPQAMVLLNDRFIRAAAGDFAKLLIEAHTGKLEKSSHRTATSDTEANHSVEIIKGAFERAFCRSPTPQEVEVSLRFVESQTKARTERGDAEPYIEAVTDFCQALFGLNEFIYVD